MRRIFCVFAFVCAAAGAQVPVTATHISDAAQRPIKSAKLCFAPVDGAQTPAGFRVGSVQVVPGAVCGTVASGVLQPGWSVVASPPGTYYHIYLTTVFTNAILRDYGLAPITGPSWTFDTFDPNTFIPPSGPKGDPGDTGPPGSPGLQGVPGPAGPAGATATVTVGAVTTLAPGSSATVANVGTQSDAVFNFGIPQGQPGSGGSGGGGSATVSVGNVSTLSPGLPASVTNTGTADAAILNFGIPKGDSGPTGATGSQGPAGPAGATGPAGPQGATGPTGAQGVAGPQGATGATGPTGPSVNLASPGPIGATTPAAGTFTSLTVPADGTHAQSQTFTPNTISWPIGANQTGMEAPLVASLTSAYWDFPSVNCSGNCIWVFGAATGSPLHHVNTPVAVSPAGLANADATSSVQAQLNAKQAALILTTTGSGPATLVGGALNIPQGVTATPAEMVLLFANVCAVQYACAYFPQWTNTRAITINSWNFTTNGALTGCTTLPVISLKQGSTVLGTITLANGGTGNYTAAGFPVNVAASSGAITVSLNQGAAGCSGYGSTAYSWIDYQMQ